MGDLEETKALATEDNLGHCRVPFVFNDRQGRGGWTHCGQLPTNPHAPLCCFLSIGVDHTQAIVLGCMGGIVAVGLGIVLAYRLSVEIYDRREYRRFEKERQQLNWKQVGRLPSTLLGSPWLGPLCSLLPIPPSALTPST